MADFCLLKSTLDVLEECPEERCAFWAEDGCALEGLRISPDLAERLLELRVRIEASGAGVDHLLLPPGLRNRPCPT